MFYICRCGNFRVETANSSTGSQDGDWQQVIAADVFVCWKFLVFTVSRQLDPEIKCNFSYCVLCSAWIMGERSDNVLLLNKQYFESNIDSADIVNFGALRLYKFLTPEYMTSENNENYSSYQDNSEVVRAISSRYLEELREKTRLKIANFEREEWASFQTLQSECMFQVEALERNLKDAFDAVAKLGCNAFPNEAKYDASLFSPDDGFPTTDDDDPPREWRDVGFKSNTDFTEADIFETSPDESSNEFGFSSSSLSGVKNSSFDQDMQTKVVSEDSGDLSLEPEQRRTMAVPMSAPQGVSNMNSRLFLSRSQPRAIPRHAVGGYPGSKVSPTDNEGNNSDQGIARTIEILARSIVSDGTELFSAPTATQTYEEMGA